MRVAVPRYLQGQQEAQVRFVGSFLCSPRRVAELRQVPPAGQRLELALVVPDGIEALEVHAAALRRLRHLQHARALDDLRALGLLPEDRA